MLERRKASSERREILKPLRVLQLIDVYTYSSHREHIKVTAAAGYHDDSTSSRMSNASDTTNQETYVNTIDNVASHPTPNTEIAARLYPDAARTIGPPLALPTNRLCVKYIPTNGGTPVATEHYLGRCADARARRDLGGARAPRGGRAQVHDPVPGVQDAGTAAHGAPAGARVVRVGGLAAHLAGGLSPVSS